MGPSERPKRTSVTAILRALLLTPIPTTTTRPIDMIILPVGIVVAVVVCLPILAGTLLAGAVVGLGLETLGAPGAVTAVPGLVGLIGGLALGFIVLLRIYRRLPRRMRSWVIPEDEDPVGVAGVLPLGRDPDRDDGTLRDRVAAADATLAADDPPTAHR